MRSTPACERTAFILRFSNQWSLKALYNIAITFIRSCTHSHTDGGVSHAKATASSSGEVRARCIAQGHLDTQLGGAGDLTNYLPVTSQPALPPEPHERSPILY